MIKHKICTYILFVQEAIKALSLTIQSNAAYLQSAANSKKHVKNDPAKLKEVEKYLLR